MKIFTKLAVCSVVCMALGCGSPVKSTPTAKVSGTVKFKGSPVGGATVSFESENAPRVGFGVTNDKGEFTITTFASGDGAVVGDHVVTVAKVDAAETRTAHMKPEDYMKSMQGGNPRSLATPGSENKGALPAIYANTKTSPLKLKVVAGQNNVFNLDLE